MNCCWLFEKVISWKQDSSAPTPLWLERHVSQCSRCSEFLHQQTHLQSALVSSAEAFRKEVPDDLHRKICTPLTSVENSENEISGGVPLWLRTALIPAVGVVVIALVLNQRKSQHFADSQTSPTSSASVELTELLSETNPSQLLAWTERVDQPLEGEMKSVVSDAKLAFRSLTRNFLPDQNSASNDSR